MVLVGLNLIPNRRCRNTALSTSTNPFQRFNGKNPLPKIKPVALDDPQEQVAYPRAQRSTKWTWSQENLVFLANLLLNHPLKTFKRYFRTRR
jgi:hypothetical protein